MALPLERSLQRTLEAVKLSYRLHAGGSKLVGNASKNGVVGLKQSKAWQ